MTITANYGGTHVTWTKYPYCYAKDSWGHPRFTRIQREQDCLKWCYGKGKVCSWDDFAHERNVNCAVYQNHIYDVNRTSGIICGRSRAGGWNMY